MNKKIFASKVKRTSLLILLFSITSLMLTNLLPIASIQNNDVDKTETYLTMSSMEHHDDSEIVDIQKDMELIVLLLDCIIVLAIGALLASILCFQKKLEFVSSLFMIVACSTIILTILTCYFCYNLSNTISNISDINLAKVAGPFVYIYILFIFYLLSTFASIAYFTAVVTFSIKKFKKYKNKKTEDKKNKTEGEKDKSSSDGMKIKRTAFEKRLLQKDEEGDKRDELEGWISDGVKDINKSEKTEDKPVEIHEEESVEPEPKVEEPIDAEERIEELESEEQISDTEENPLKQVDELPSKTPFGDKPVKKEQDLDSSDVKPSKTFEKALFSAIEKKQVEKRKNQSDPKIKKNKKETKKEKIQEKKKEGKNINAKQKSDDKKDKTKAKKVEESNAKVKFNVRCPTCKNIFVAEKTGKKTKIKCPECGKEGIIN